MALAATDVHIRYSTAYSNILPIQANSVWPSLTSNNTFINILPTMTSNTTPAPYVISANSEYSTVSPNGAWCAFDNNINTAWTTQTGTTTGIININLGAVGAGGVGPTILTQYQIYGFNTAFGSTGQTPKNWTFQGSTDNVAWTTLDTQTNQTTWTSGLIRTYGISTPTGTPYQYYRLNITANNGDGNYLIISNIAFSNTPVVSASTQYGQQAYFAFDDTIINAWIATTNTGDLTIDTGQALAAIRYGITGHMDTGASPATWTFQGSNDTSAWTTLDTQTTVTWTPNQQRFYNFTNSTTYRFYKLHVTANNGSTNLAVTELVIYSNVARNNRTIGYPWLSLGGNMSLNDVNPGFDSLVAPAYDTLYVTGTGAAQYRCLFAYNNNATTAWTEGVINTSYITPGGYTVNLGVDPGGPSPTNAIGVFAQTIANGTTAPAGVTFNSPIGGTSSVTLGTLQSGQCRAFWVKLTPIATIQSQSSNINLSSGILQPLPGAVVAGAPATSDIHLRYSNNNNPIPYMYHSNIVPNMNANTMVYNGITYVASASDAYAGTWDAFRAFDHNFGGSIPGPANDNYLGYGWSANTNATPQWLQIDLGSGNAQIVTQYRIMAWSSGIGGVSNVYGPKTWTLQGANTDSWPGTTLDTQTNAAVWGSNEVRVYNFTNPTAYRYYRINITVTQNASYNVLMSKVWLFAPPTITATETGYPSWWAFSGRTESTTGDFWAACATLPVNTRVDFGAGNTQVIKQYTIISRSEFTWLTQSPKTWTIQGSNDNSVSPSSWTILDTQINVPPWNANERRTYNIATANQAAYRHYMMNVTANFGDGCVTIQSISLVNGPGGTNTGTFATSLGGFVSTTDVNFPYNLNNTAPATTVPVMTSNSAPSPYVASASTESGGLEAYHAFSNILDANWSSTSATNSWIQIDLYTAVTVKAYSFVSRVDLPGTAPQSWSLQGSNDNSTWAILDVQAYTPRLYGRERRYHILSNPGSYRYYRLYAYTNNSAAIPIDPWIQLNSLNLYPANPAQYRCFFVHNAGSNTLTGGAIAILPSSIPAGSTMGKPEWNWTWLNTTNLATDPTPPTPYNSITQQALISNNIYSPPTNENCPGALNPVGLSWPMIPWSGSNPGVILAKLSDIPPNYCQAVWFRFVPY